ncbi:hypothetical protein GCM10008967_32940 [Bacillus carboniphilus]|uniref:N-acetyltransferase domain-containing protein n=1 Tax=Bacillus carboniphilus TaxID=86663 RepID=A0ABP3GCT6_9BACI
MYITKWAKREELGFMADYWYQMASEMAEIDGVPKPDTERHKRVKALFEKEWEAGKLMFRVVVDQDNQIVACAGGLLRTEYAFPLAEEQTPFGWVIAVYTEKQHRNKGLAAKLVDEVCVWLKEKGAHRARLWSSTKAREVYEKLGFSNMLDMSKSL